MANQDTTLTRRPGKIDWDAAFAYFASDATRSFGEVARKFGVSDTAVRNHAKPGDWLRRRAEMHAQAAANVEQRVMRKLEERQFDTVRVAERLREIALAPEAEIDLDAALRMLPVYAKLEQLYAGEATDRVALGEVQIVIQAVVAVAGRWVASELPPAERRAGFLAELETATSGTPLEASAA